MKTMLLILPLLLSTALLVADDLTSPLTTVDGKTYPDMKLISVSTQGVTIFSPGYRYVTIPFENLQTKDQKALQPRIAAAKAKLAAQTEAAAKSDSERLGARQDADALRATKTFDVVMKNGTVHHHVVGSELEASGVVRRLLRQDEAVYSLLRVLISDLTPESKKKLETVAASAGKK